MVKKRSTIFTPQFDRDESQSSLIYEHPAAIQLTTAMYSSANQGTGAVFHE
jgi:hypothetical protein